jgi:hypothetical protein
MLNEMPGVFLENSVIITVRSDIGAGFRGSDQGVAALLYDTPHILDHLLR